MRPRNAQRPPRIRWRAVRYVCPSLSPQQAQTIAAGLAPAMKQFGIVTPERAAMFVAQCAHESDRFKTSTEYASGAGYEGRRDLGNVHAGDGVRFKGRGRIMVTGRGNYTAVSKAMKRNFVARPDELATSPWSEIGSGWWWYSHGLNQICDQYANVEARLKAATYRINGGFNGLDDRRYFLQRARRVKRWLVPR